MAAFQWWLLIVGLVIGAGLVWLVLSDAMRREEDILEEEVPGEAAWISAVLSDEGVKVDQLTAERILRLHRVYLASLPPDETPDEVADVAATAAVGAREVVPARSAGDMAHPIGHGVAPTSTAAAPPSSGASARSGTAARPGRQPPPRPSGADRTSPAGQNKTRADAR
jgi:hypothetical protein